MSEIINLALQDCLNYGADIHVQKLGWAEQKVVTSTKNLVIKCEQTKDGCNNSIAMLETQFTTNLYGNKKKTTYILCNKYKDSYLDEYTYEEFNRTTDKSYALYLMSCWEVGYKFLTNERHIHKCPYCGEESVYFTDQREGSVTNAHHIKNSILNSLNNYSYNNFDEKDGELRINKNFKQSDKMPTIPSVETWDVDIVKYTSISCNCEESINDLPF